MGGGIGPEVGGAGGVAEVGFVVLVGAVVVGAVGVALAQPGVGVVGADGRTDLGEVGGVGARGDAGVDALQVVAPGAVGADCDAVAGGWVCI